MSADHRIVLSVAVLPAHQALVHLSACISLAMT